MTVYSFDKIRDFKNKLHSTQLESEIESHVEIIQNLVGIVVTGDIIEIEFSDSLSARETIFLRQIISSHVPGEILSSLTLKPYKTEFNLSSYSVAMEYIYPGTFLNRISGFKVYSYIDSGVTSYDIRVMDVTNNLVIAEINLDNHDMEINDMGAIANIPSSESIFEFQVKRNGGSSNKKCYLTSIAINFGKN